jgi:hypothetical protein
MGATMTDPYDDMYRTNLSVWREEEGRPVAEADIEILARCPVLWSGWECDFAVILYRVRSTGETGLHVVAGVSHPGDRGPVDMLRGRLEAYREAIRDTETFLAKVAEILPSEAGNSDGVGKED